MFHAFRRMFHMFHLDVAYISVVIYIRCKRLSQNVSSISDVRCKYFYVDVTIVIHICYRAYVANVLPVLDVCYRNALYCNISSRMEQVHTETVPAGIVVPTCAASKTGVGSPRNYMRGQTCRLRSMCGRRDGCAGMVGARV
jgi:hypothetical protein